MKGYWIAKYKTIENKDKLESYAELAIQAIKDFGGTAVVRGGKYQTFEGDEFIRTVIWEFQDYNTAINCYKSEKYQKAWSLAKETTIRDLLIVEGV